MKARFIYVGLLSLTAVACTMTEVDAPVVPSGPEFKPFYATIEDQPDHSGTRTFTDESLRIFWNQEDHITVFNNVTGGKEYAFTGEDGDAGGGFDPYGDSFAGGEELDGMVYAVYPYKKGTKISHDGIITYTLPAIQTYQENSFGAGANAMVAKTVYGNYALRFKNVCGYLSFKLYGSGVSVSSVILKGNNGESLAGTCDIDMSTGLPVITTMENATDEVRLYCNKPVDLNASADDFTEFWFALPPQTFGEGGFTITVTTDDGGVYTKTAAMPLEIERNKIKRMAPLKVTPKPYTGSDITIESISSDRNGVTYYAEEDENTAGRFILTIPTLTDFSGLVLDYEIEDGDVLIVNGETVECGVTPVDASQEVDLTVCRGNREKRYTLKARNTNLPIVRITTQGFDREDIDGDTEHKTWRGSSKDTPSENAWIRIEYPDGHVDWDDIKLQVKGRGNASWTYPKKPYALKFDKKKSVLGMPAHKRWVLLANWKDRTLLRNEAAFWLSRQTGLPYTVRGEFVELEFNGEHRGNYYLCEQIKIDPERVNITEMAENETGAEDPLAITGGYLMEIDNNWDDDNSFNSAEFKYKYQFKIPDEKDRSAEAWDYMTAHIAKVEGLFKKIPNNSKEYRDYFDTESAIWFMFVNELTSNGDFYNENYSDTYKGPHSTYMYKDRDSLDVYGNLVVSKIHMGPVWDFDYLTFMPSRANKWSGATQKNYYYNYFFADSDFLAEMKQMWADSKAGFQGLPDHIDLMAEKIRVSEEINAKMWWNTRTYGNKDQNQNGELNMNFDQAVANIKSGFNSKWEFMDGDIKNLKYQKPGSSWGW